MWILGDDLYEHAAKQGRVDMLKWLTANSCPSERAKQENCASKAAAAGDHLPALKWLHDMHFLCNAATFDAAGAAGHLNIVRWAHSKWAHHKGDMFTTKTVCEAAAMNAHLHILKWVYGKVGNLDFNQETCRAAAQAGNTYELYWLVKKGCPWNRDCGGSRCE